MRPRRHPESISWEQRYDFGMSRLAAVLAVVAVVLLPGAAHAQEAGLRDPFDPLLTTGDETTTTTDTGNGDTTSTIDTTTDTDIDTVPTEDLPTTGTDPRSWLALAYVLLAAGAGILAYARFNRGHERAR